MSVISTEMYEALLLANVPADKAKAAAGEVAKTQDFVTKSDLLELGAQLQSKLDWQSADSDKRFAGIGRQFDEVNKQFDAVNKQFDEMRKQFVEVNTQFDEMRKQFVGVNTQFAELEKSLAVLRFAVFSVGPIILALLIKLVFFP